MARLFDHNNANYLDRTSVNLGLNGLTEMSCAAWLKVTAVDAAINLRLVSKEIAAVGQQTFDVFLGIDSSNVVVRLENNDLVETPLWASTTGCGLGIWTRVLWTWKRNTIDVNDLLLYYNAVSQPKTFSGTYTSSFVLKENSESLVYGNSAALDRPLDGALEWVTVWNRQLTPVEVEADYLNQKAVPSGMISQVQLCPDAERIFGGAMTIHGTVACVASAPLSRRQIQPIRTQLQLVMR
jgi:hypothetical protein